MGAANSSKPKAQALPQAIEVKVVESKGRMDLIKERAAYIDQFDNSPKRTRGSGGGVFEAKNSLSLLNKSLNTALQAPVPKRDTLKEI